MRPAIFLLAPLFLASSLLCQQECVSTHDDGTIVTNVSTGGVPLAYRMTAAKAMTISALELYTGKRAGTGTLSIYAHDPVNNTPTTIRGGKASYTQRIMEGWQGAQLPSPVSLQQGEVYWIVWENPSGSRINWSTDPNGTIHYRGFVNAPGMGHRRAGALRQ